MKECSIDLIPLLNLCEQLYFNPDLNRIYEMYAPTIIKEREQKELQEQQEHADLEKHKFDCRKNFKLEYRKTKDR